MTFSPDYVRLVLSENFADAVAGFLEPLLAIHEAHLVMLADQGIVSAADARTLARALATIDPADVRTAPYDGEDEDLFFYIERTIAAACGRETAGRMHTARSRNDIDMTLYRLRLRDQVAAVLAATLDLRQALARHAGEHTASVFPAHTHTQPAQPTTVAHYLQAVVEQLERDGARLLAALATINRCPLGACAITGTGFAIDRDRTSDLLGFDGPTGNTYGSIATVDYLIEAAGATVNLVTGCGRVVQDLLLWSTVEVGYLRLGDGFVQSSSIMPQKRNPVGLEHTRALLSKAFGQLIGVVQAVHNTPFGDIVDTEDDLQPLVAQAFHDARRGVALLAAATDDATFDVARMAARAGTSWVTATELADTLARDHGLPFVSAHAIAATVVRQCDGDPSKVFEVFRRVADEAGVEVTLSNQDLTRILSPAHFVRVRETPGGPGPRAIAAALGASSRALASDRQRLSAMTDAWRDADARRHAAVEALRAG
ncbi:MAG: argininosuccinate lyase [Acidobacteria bacterium]|nr:argininosuccinate lyase [Acidobacteriota bacterium]